MLPEDQLLYLFARQELTPGDQQAIKSLAGRNAIDWERLFDTAVKLGIAPLIHALIQRHPELDLHIPKPASQRLYRYVARNVLREARREQRLHMAIDNFRSRSMRVMLIKAAALKVAVYDCPWYTIAHDLDVILDRRRQSFAQAELAQLRRSLGWKGIEFDFYEHHDVNMNGVLNIDFDAVWRDARPVAYAGREVWLMCPEDLLISLCINCCRKRFFWLKSLCDIGETVRRYPTLDWTALAEKARQYGCQNIVYAALYVTSRTLGLDMRDSVLDSLNVSRVRAMCIRACADFQLKHVSPTSHVSGGIRVFGRKLDSSLLLPYTTFSLLQFVRKIAYFQQTSISTQSSSG
jgi:hypothetical protein